MLHDPQQPPNFEDLQALVLLAQTGSFTAAAKRLRVPKSTVSRRIARLEEDLQTALVVRTSRKVSISEAGQVYLERIRSALEAIEDASRAARQERERPRGHLRVSAPFDVAFRWLAEILPRFRARYPDITLDVLVDQRRVDLVAEGIDVAIRAAMHLDDSSLIARKLASIPMALFASPSYLEARGRPRRVEDLARHDVLTFPAATGPARLVLQGPKGQSRTIELAPVAIRSNDPMFLARLAARGHGIASIPVPFGGAEPGLEPVLPEWSTGRASLYCVYPSSRLVPAKVRAFRDFLVEHAANLERR